MPTDIKTLIDKGLKMEDEFIQTYMSVIKDEGFSSFFESNEPQAKEILQTLIDESTEHKASLEEILATL